MIKRHLIVCLILVFSGNIFAASVILNEYNAVDSDEFLNGGTASADDNGSRASDSYFGRVLGNGGDWFELVVITDHLDMRGWEFDISSSKPSSEVLYLTTHSIWSNLRSGTIITVSENVPSDISYDPAAGDWWINVQAKTDADGLYIGAHNFAVNSSNWQLVIKNSGGTTMYGPVGEGIGAASGVGNTEICRLEADPSAIITPGSSDYDDGKELSTFGSPNEWGVQDVFHLRDVVAKTSTLTLVSPNGSEVIMGGTTYDILWGNTGTVDSALIDFSTDNGSTWIEVYPPNVGNEGSYSWLVPIVDSEECIVRVRNGADLAVYDTSNAVFTIYECFLDGDLTGDCKINLSDLAVIADFWLL